MRNPNTDPLLTPVNEAGFALDEVVLFLDTHPYYRQAKMRYEQAVSAYENQRGPLMMNHVNDSHYWTWVDGPWPWEGGCR